LQTDPNVAVPFATNTASVGGHQPTSIGVGAPAGFFIGQSYPNPTNQVTTMSFHSAVSGNATVKIYDVNGREVSTLMNARQEPGNYSVQWAPSTATANGTYFAVLYLNGSRVQTQKITVSK
jgi:flagellar hook assembly protein FlgD